MSSPSRPVLRRDMRRRRRELTAAQRKAAARAALGHFRSIAHLRRGMRIAVYLSAGAELDTAPFIELARRRGCHLYAPVVRGDRRMLRFAGLEPPLRTNRFGILEPRFNPRRCIDARRLELVLVPLLAFGPNGERLGSGAGFYDQTFAFLRRRRAWRKPRLIGLAYHWQALPELSSEAWDVPLEAIATDRYALRFTRR